MSKKKKIILVAVFVVVLAATAIAAVLLNRKTTVAGGKEFQVEIISDRDSYNEIASYSSEEEYLGQFLRTMEKCEWQESDYGIYITGFDGMEEDMDNQYWWCISVNGETATTGADEIPIVDGDVYTFTLTQGW